MLFEGLSLELRPGEMLHVTGPNGSGKSSLLRLAAGLLRAERGTIDRAPLSLADDHLALDRELPLRRALGFWSEGVDEAMEALGLGHLAQVPVRLLSAGQAKRATIARTAASGMPLWLLDEPLNGLDTEGAIRVARVIKAHIATGGAVIAASHLQLSGKWRRLALGA